MKRLFKAIGVVLCIVVMSFSVGCGTTPSPAAVVNAFLDSFQRNDQEGMKRYSVDGVFDQAFEDMNDPLVSLVMEKARRIDYLTVGESANGDVAHVTVTIRTYDFGTAFQNGLSETLNRSIEIGEDELTEDMINEFLQEDVMYAFERATMNLISSCTINLVKVNDVWKVDSYSNNADMVDLITGYVTTIIEDLY